MDNLDFNRVNDLMLATLPASNSPMAQRLRELYTTITAYVAEQIATEWGPLSWEQEEAIHNLCLNLAMFQTTACVQPASDLLAVLRTRYREVRAAFGHDEYTLLGMIVEAAHAISR